MKAMALRREDLSAEALERQAALDRSWADAQRALADPAFRSRLERTIEQLDGTDPAPVLTRAEFLARTPPVE
ncbi:MAG: hypothetical protein ACKVWR_16020 [Acidimicrobiales bacterium]